MSDPEFQARIRPLAATDLEETVRFMDAHSEDAGDRFLKEFFRVTAELAKKPALGPVRRARGRLKGLRSWQMKGFEAYRIFYLPIDVGIDVIRVLHSARDIERELRRK
ncbi:MAG TPA: type II toxin-antitoxin system RelE/ParE family toxin [Tepidisphaeraceae bacterium]|nr:type II toxin-antitoxin system RelE/ParE family toxin [Tepidisphaeraceae bacterium]